MSVSLRSFAWIIFLLRSLVVVSSAGPGPDKMASVRIQTLTTFRPQVAGQGEIHWYLTRWFEAQGVKVVGKAEWIVGFSALTIDESGKNQVVLATGLGRTLPKEVIDPGKESEGFYSFLPTATKASLPKEGSGFGNTSPKGFCTNSSVRLTRSSWCFHGKTSWNVLTNS